MSSVQSFELYAPRGTDYTNFFTKSGDMRLDYSQSGNITVIVTDSSDAYAIYKDTSKQSLFPNAIAHPIKMDLQYNAFTFGISWGRATLWVNGTNVFQKQGSWSSDTTISDLGGTPAILASTTRDSEIKWQLEHGSLMGISVSEIILRFYFTRYDFSAHALGEVSTVSVTPNGYDGDQITWSAAVNAGAVWKGWYTDAEHTQLYNASQTFTETVNGADRTLYAWADTPVRTLAIQYAGVSQSFDVSQDSAFVVYNDVTIATVNVGQSVTLQCRGKIMATNVTIAGHTLLCEHKYMSDNVVVELTT